MDIAKNFYDDYDVEVSDNDDFDVEYLDLDEEEVLKNEVEREKNLKEELLRLMGKQATLILVNGVNSFRKTRMQISNIRKGLEEKAQMYEKDYTVSRNVKKSALEEYSKALDKLESNYREVRIEKLNEKKDYERKQHEAMDAKSAAISEKKKMLASKEYKKYLQDIKSLKKEINLAIEEDNDEKLATKRQELRELKIRSPKLQYDRKINEADKTIEEMEDKIAETKEFLADWDKAKDMGLSRIKNNRDTALSLVKQSFWQKLVGSIVNKFYKAGKVKNSAFEQIKMLAAQINEERKIMIERYEKWQEENDNIKAEKAKEKAQAKAVRTEEKAQVKAERAEEKRKHKEEIIKSIENRIAETEKQIQAAIEQRAQYNVKNVTPALASGNGNIVPFERD